MTKIKIPLRIVKRNHPLIVNGREMTQKPKVEVIIEGRTEPHVIKPQFIKDSL